jgi:predicted hotdog family 3-hydroxylacyl-ACP dehydratase
MIWLESLRACSEGHAICEAEVRQDCPAVVDGLLPAVALLEHMGQAVAAHAGMRHRAKGTPVGPGVVMSCRELTLSAAALPVGTRLEIEVHREMGDGATARYACEVRVGLTVAARGTLSVYQGDLTRMGAA